MITRREAFYIRRIGQEIVSGAAGVAVISAVSYGLHLDFAIAGCLYLLLVVLGSTFANFFSCAMVSVIAIACLDYFFVPPLFTLRINRPLDALATLTFLVTALVITRLASRERESAQRADGRRRDLARLYELASRLVALSPVVVGKREYLGIFRDIFRLKAVCLFDADAASASCVGGEDGNLLKLTKGACLLNQDFDDDDFAIRCLRTAGKPIGTIGFEGLKDADSLAGPLSVLAAGMIQRAHYFETASAAAAAHQIEVLRSAVLDAFAHQFKTPLASIMAAAGTVRETGPLTPEQEDMVETIESQAAGLGSLTTRLLRMARLDRDDIKPRLQLTDLSAAVARLADQYRNQANGQVLVLRMPDERVRVPSDPEMLSLAIVQLLDNAFRYSPPGSTVTVTVRAESDFAIVLVANEGRPIAPEEQNRIFERFYRGSAHPQSSGTGLGLYVARKIVTAHGGTLEHDQNGVYGPETTFCLKLPLVRSECEHEIKPSYSFGS
jgi:two-component system sensor histidine kinase KdpD